MYVTGACGLKGLKMINVLTYSQRCDPDGSDLRAEY
jgi:hypothetical protein